MVFGTCPATCPHFHLPQSLTQPYSHVYCFPKSSTLSSSSRLREMAATPGPVHDAGWLSVWSECADWAAWVAGGDRLGEGQLEQVFQGEDLILHLPLPSMYLGSLQLDLDFLMGKQFQRLRPTIQGCYENRGCGRGSPNDPTNQGFSAWMMARMEAPVAQRPTGSKSAGNAVGKNPRQFQKASKAESSCKSPNLR